MKASRRENRSKFFGFKSVWKRNCQCLRRQSAIITVCYKMHFERKQSTVMSKQKSVIFAHRYFKKKSFVYISFRLTCRSRRCIIQSEKRQSIEILVWNLSTTQLSVLRRQRAIMLDAIKRTRYVNKAQSKVNKNGFASYRNFHQKKRIVCLHRATVWQVESCNGSTLTFPNQRCINQSGNPTFLSQRGQFPW